MSEARSAKDHLESENRRTIAVVVLAFVMLGFAVFALAERHIGSGLSQFLLAGVGMAIVVWSLVSRVWGLLIPGCVALSMGAGIVVLKEFELVGVGKGGACAIFAGAGWFLLTFLSAIGFHKRILWPLIPGGVLTLIGCIQLSGPDVRAVLPLLNEYWPFVAIVASVWLLATAFRTVVKAFEN